MMMSAHANWNPQKLRQGPAIQPLRALRQSAASQRSRASCALSNRAAFVGFRPRPEGQARQSQEFSSNEKIGSIRPARSGPTVSFPPFEKSEAVERAEYLVHLPELRLP